MVVLKRSNKCIHVNTDVADINMENANLSIEGNIVLITNKEKDLLIPLDKIKYIEVKDKESKSPDA